MWHLLSFLFIGCEPSANFTFENDFVDSSKEKVYVGKDNVTIHDGSAMFTGNGMVNMYRFANVPFKTELVMDLQFDSSEAGKCHVY